MILPACRFQHLEALLLEVFYVPPVLQSVQVGVERKFEHMFHLENETLHTHETHRHYRLINQQGVLMTPDHRDSVCSSGYLGVVNMS